MDIIHSTKFQLICLDFKNSIGHYHMNTYLLPLYYKKNKVQFIYNKTSANLENSAVATGLEKVSFLHNSKERWSQRMLK